MPRAVTMADLAAEFRRLADVADRVAEMKMSKIRSAEWLATAVAYRHCANRVDSAASEAAKEET